MFRQPRRIASVTGPDCSPSYTDPDDETCAGLTEPPNMQPTAAPTAPITCNVGQIAIISFDSGSSFLISFQRLCHAIKYSCVVLFITYHRCPGYCDLRCVRCIVSRHKGIAFIYLFLVLKILSRYVCFRYTLRTTRGMGQLC